MAELKTGPLSREELLEVWRGATDKSFSDPLIAAGEGNGLEAYTQLMEQLARASTGVDITTQAMFITPWSGQTNPPAAGEARATVTLTFARTKLVDKPLVLGAGLVFVEHRTTDWGPDGGVPVLTGRRYVLTETLVFHPGETGPFDVPAIAERPGWGYNNPLPGTIVHVQQPGSGFAHERATVTTFSAAAPPPFSPAIASRVDLITVNEADTFVPEHVGQYVSLLSSTSASNLARIVSFLPPDLSVFPAVGSAVQLELEQSFEGASTGAFIVGETVHFQTSPGVDTGSGRVLGERDVIPGSGGPKRVTFVLLSGAMSAIGTMAVGALSGATTTVAIKLFEPAYAPDAPVGGVGGTSWRVLDWVEDWGLTVTNVLSPANGRLGFLDELGSERNLSRGPNESDGTYRQRVHQIADVVTPNAIRRTLSRVMGTLPWCFREVGRSELPGFFFDGDLSPVGSLTTLAAANKNDAFDTDVVLFTIAAIATPFDPVDANGFPVAQERVEYRSAADDVLMTGYLGRIVGGAGGTFTFIRTGRNRVTAIAAGDYITGVSSGGVLTPAAIVVTPTVDARRFRELFDYTEFRAFFLVGVPRLGDGEFGFAYDLGPSSAYDAAPYSAFYDGYPYLAAQFYQRISQALDEVRAGGVGFAMYLEEIGCP